MQTEDNAALIDSMILCKFLRGVFEDSRAEWAALLEAVTGFDYTADELSEIAGNIIDEKKRYNVEQGWRPADDTLPDRFLSEPMPTGGGSQARLPRQRLEHMIAAYYGLRGWSADGYPPDVGSDPIVSAGSGV